MNNDLSKSIQTILDRASAPSVLTWKSKKVAGALITKIGSQRYLGLVRKDKKGQEYWRYHLLTNASESSANSLPNPAPISQPDSPVQSVQVKQSPDEKGLENSKAVERSPDSFSQEKGFEESEEVKKFREKYGNPNEPANNSAKQQDN